MRPRVFVSSWLFAPYPGSADVDLLKRLRHCETDFDVVQARRTGADSRLFDFRSAASFERTEIELADGPRTTAGRDSFKDGVMARFAVSGQRAHAILSHSNEVPSHAAVLELRRSGVEIPWVAYFGDVVSKNPYVKHMAEYPLFEEDGYVEHQTLNEAAVVVCNNEHQRALFRESMHPARRHRAVVIPHAYEQAFYPTSPVAENERFTFMHIGSLYSVKRRAEPVLKGVDKLLEVYPHLEGRFDVVFVGDEVDGADLSCWERMTHRDHVRFFPGVSYLASLALMRHADALIVIDGIFDVHRDGLTASPYFPGKLADYLGAAKPILALTMRRGPTAEFLAERGELIADESPERIAFVLKRYIEGHVQPSVPPRRLRAEVVGAMMDVTLRSAIIGDRAIEGLDETLSSFVRRATEP